MPPSQLPRRDPRFLKALAAAGGLCLLVLLLALGLLGIGLEGEMAGQWRGLLAERWPLLLPALLLPWLLAAAVLLGWHRRHLLAALRLAEAARAGLDEPATSLPREGEPELVELASILERLGTERRALREEIQARAAEAARRVELERQRLAALMNELSQAVIVCNREGRILLYNERARSGLQGIAGSDWIGLGRSIDRLLDRRLIDHGLESLAAGAESMTCNFMAATTAGGWLRVQLAAVRALAAGSSGETPAATDGYVLVLEDVSAEFEAQRSEDRRLLDFSLAARAALANAQAALSVLELADLDAEQGQRFQTVVREELGSLATAIERLGSDTAMAAGRRWPLQTLLGDDLLGAAQRRLAEWPAIPVEIRDSDRAETWLRADGFSLLQALQHLAGRVQAGSGSALRLSAAGPDRLHLDLCWPGTPPDAQRLREILEEPIQIGEERFASSVEEVLERHQAQLWPGREGERAFLRLLLPAAVAADKRASELPRAGGRPAFYDFDLFQSGESGRQLADTPLSALRYTVFDTETTGIDPNRGDRIVQIGAVRIVNGRLLEDERFDQLIDPQRPLSPASVAVHGIRSEQLRGQPTIPEVLPRFHRYASDSVLVAHNAAFDMRFLEVEQQGLGLRFDQPVLDTLLLSSLVAPNQDSHRLDAIAARFGIAIPEGARHNALGDALLTARILLRLIPLLAERDIHTLEQAREASRLSWYAGLGSAS